MKNAILFCYRLYLVITALCLLIMLNVTEITAFPIKEAISQTSCANFMKQFKFGDKNSFPPRLHLRQSYFRLYVKDHDNLDDGWSTPRWFFDRAAKYSKDIKYDDKTIVFIAAAAWLPFSVSLIHLKSYKPLEVLTDIIAYLVQYRYN